MSTSLYWDDTKHIGMLGGQEIVILAHLQEREPDQGNDPFEAHAIIYMVADGTHLMLLRWKVGASVQLPTNDIIHAKNAVLAMLRMEENDD